MASTHREIFERYTWTGMTRNADARADMFTPDGVLESPLTPSGSAFPRRIEGREEIRTFLTAENSKPPTTDGKVLVDKSRYILHDTSDSDTFVAEIDATMEVSGEMVIVSLVQIFHLGDGAIAMVRDYYAPELMNPDQHS